ncbi:hypothetical protein VPNG_02347 [Cytospora leucostoma]|uniref:Mitochondrial import inner membrane translocase subunit TIM50 n=1 Tax=Cytospora leucostoma TaxID=1230097 RepID=A0A423XGY4_9PEZI|nr:hypothetical protein VPNG_02347 [Cytospora leucostoma]
MGKKKDKLRAREAAEAARQAQSQAELSTATGNASVAQDGSVGGFPGNPQGYHQDPGSSTPANLQWPAMDALMAANGLANNNGGWPPIPMVPQMMNGLQGFNMSMFQPNGFLPMMQMPYGNMASFSTASPSLFPGQPPYPAGDHDYQAPLQPQRTSPDLPLRTRSPGRRGHSPHQGQRKPAPRAAITAPSEASGGIPDPTPSYLVRASFLPKRRATPGPLLVVIDLNGTLLHRPDKRKPFNFRARPHAHQFVRYCIETFWVVIWSSARPDNVKRMVGELTDGEQLGRVVAVWGRDRFGLTHEDYNARTQCYKRLTALWSDPVVAASYPADREGFAGRCWDQGNTVLIDDSVEKARSEPHNAITIPEFTGDMTTTPDILPMVHDYLNELCYQEDVSAYIRANPFKMA